MPSEGEPEQDRQVNRRPVNATVKAIGTVLATGVGIIGLYHAFNMYVDARVTERIHDPRFLTEISRSLRPAVVFNSRETILADLGAMAKLKSISVTTGGDRSNQSFVITVEPNEYLGVEPVLESLDFNGIIEGARGRGLTWVFTVTPILTLALDESPTPGPPRFRLEILH
jgi:hypothetical protein